MLESCRRRRPLRRSIHLKNERTARAREDGPAVVAFGGNALLPDPFHPEDQEERARSLAAVVLRILRRARGVVLVHGNGPQVGMILLRVDQTRDRLPAEPLDVLVAETQGSVGYLLSRVLRNALLARGSDVEVSSILTQVTVDPKDVAFDEPTKPIGPAYDDERARELREAKGWALVHEDGRGWRRVVPSPRPIDVVELGFIERAARAGGVVVAGGGGGVPVVETDAGFEGVEAVVDKDRTAATLATGIGASSFIVLTGVPHVSEGFGTPGERRIARLSVAEARARINAGEFPAGSMQPKIEAACDYVEATRAPAWITDTASLERALRGEAGTKITFD